jgi:hypothetical protein
MEMQCQVLRARTPRARRRDLILGPPATSSRFSPTAAKPYASLDCVMTSKSIVSARSSAVSSRHVARDTDGPKNPMAVGFREARPANRYSQYSPARTEG